MRWREVSLVTDFESSDMLQSMMLESGAGGVELYDPALLLALEGTVLEAGESLPDVELPFDRKVVVKAYFPDDGSFPETLERIRSVVTRLADDGLVKQTEVTTKPVDEDDWAHAWKQYFKPVKLGKGLLVVPSWLADEASAIEGWDELTPIFIDPGMAFGTGTHPTTALCLELLEDHIYPGCSFADIGTGSGILSIAAARLGGRGVAIDVDAVAVRAAVANIALNELESCVQVHLCDLADGSEAEACGLLPGAYDVVVANIVAQVILRLMPSLARLLADRGKLILSGIIEDKLEPVARALDEHGMDVVSIKSAGEWRAITAGRKGAGA